MAIVDNSWHFNYGQGKSLIKELVDMLDETNYMEIWTSDGDYLFVTSEDRIDIGARAILVSSDNNIDLINTNYIIRVNIHRKSQDNNNI